MTTSLIVDGYNVIQAADRYAVIAERDLDTARAILISDVSAYAFGSHDATVVFDGAKNPESDGTSHQVAGVEVIFSPYGKDADSIIEELPGRLGGAGDDVFVVTSDSQTQWVVLGQGATRVSSAQFVADLSEGASEMFEHTPSGEMRSTLDQRIDKATRDALARWARGKK